MAVYRLAATLFRLGLAVCLLGGCSAVGVRRTEMQGTGPVSDNAIAQAVGHPRLASASARDLSRAEEDRSSNRQPGTGGDPKTVSDAGQPPSAPIARHTDSDIRKQLTIASLDDSQLGDIRGGLDTGSGLELNFAFQQATFVDHNLVQNVVVPTITVSPSAAASAAGPAAASGAPMANIQAPTISTASFAGLGVGGLPSGTVTTLAGAGTVVSNGTSIQIMSPTSAVPSAAGGGAASVLTTLGGGGLTNIVANTANNQLVQQLTTINIGVTGLQQLVQQGIPAAVMSQLNSVKALSR
jgi:hypothetical protein